MRRVVQYALGTFTGVVAGTIAYTLSAPLVETGSALFVAGLTATTWGAAILVYLRVYETFDSPPAHHKHVGMRAALSWGGLAGGAASLGVAGLVGLLGVQSVPLRYSSAVGLFMMGTVILNMAVGMRVSTLNRADT